MATPSLVSRAARSIPIHAVPKDAYDAWLKKQRREVRTWLDSVDFSPKAHRFELVPGRDGKLEAVVVGVDSFDTPWALAGLSAKLPKGAYRLETPLSSSDATNACVGWLLGTYRFTRYKKKPPTFGASLVVPKGADVKRAELIASALRLSRDLINTPAEDMGPSELAAEARKLGRAHRARVTVIRGNELLRKNYPTIHTVGRASDDPPHLIDLVWGSASHPKVTLVGKGVCFDSGGLDLKPASGMLTMKKDMGGAAAVLGVAKLIMGARLPVRLRVLVPAVENSVSGNAYRPLDVIKTRKGITVEIGNTDAEGRLVLSDALTEACREKPDVLIDFATLTGAARVALGTDLPALFTNDDALAAQVLDAGVRVHDRLWRMPLHDDYRSMLDSAVADINNSGQGGYGGAITAALFLKEFIEDGIAWAHIDTMAWNLSSRPGRPVGGEGMAVRAVFSALEARYTKRGRTRAAKKRRRQ